MPSSAETMLTTIRPRDIVVAVHNYTTSQSNYLSLQQGDVIYVLDKNINGWWDGIVLTSSNKIVRGWFPQNYAKRIRDPSLKKKYLYTLSNAFSRSAGNTLSPCRRSSSCSSESPSSVSMSPTNSFISNTYLNEETGPSMRPLSFTSDIIEETSEDTITLLSLQEVEMILNGSTSNKNDTRSRNASDSIPIWTPVSTTNGDKIIYYNKALNIYCSQLPLVATATYSSTETLGNENSTKRKKGTVSKRNDYPVDDHLVDLYPKNLQNVSNNTNNDHINKSNSYPNLHSKSRINSISNPNILNLQQQTTISNYSNNVHNFDKRDLFYQHSTDIRLWSELRDITLYYSKIANLAFTTNNREDFNDYFALLSTYATYTNLVCHLTKNHFNDSNLIDVLKDTKPLLKKTISSLSKIGVCSTIYFNSDDFFLNLNKDLLNKTQARSTSTSTQDTITTNDVNNINSNNTKNRVNSVSTSIQGKKKSFVNHELTVDIIESEFLKFNKSIIALHDICIQCDEYIPQVVPRFFKGSFNGGSWTNPFYNPMTKNNSCLKATDIINVLNNNRSSSSTNLPSRTASNHSLNQKSRNHSANTISTLCSSTNNSSKTLFNNKLSARSKKGFNKKPSYPLTYDTLTLLKNCANQVDQKVFANDGEHLKVIDEKFSKKRNLEITSKTYEEISSNLTLLEIMENLDLNIFVNLKKLSHTLEDVQTEEFLNYTLSTISSILSEFFDVKQSLHDVIVKLIVTAQQASLDDDLLVFSSMRTNFPIGYEDPSKKDIPQFDNIPIKNRRLEKFSIELYKDLVSQDVELNNEDFIDISDDLKEAFMKYAEMSNVACTVVEQLIEERENLLNYSARMMKNDLISELLQNDQDKWFDNGNTSDLRGKLKSRASEDLIMTINDQNLKMADESDESRKSSAVGYNDEPTFNSEQNDGIPWYLRCDNDYSLIYDAKHNVKGGTREALIEHLVSNLKIDASFNVTMLITFRSMFTTMEFLLALVHNYNLSPPEGLCYDEYNIWMEKKLNPIKCNVVNIMKTLFSEYWSHVYCEPGVGTILNFAELTQRENIPGSKDLKYCIEELLDKDVIRKQNAELSKLEPTVTPNLDSVKSSITTSAGALSNSAVATPSPSLFRNKKIKLLDIAPYTYATQLTILEQDAYLKISMFDCLDRVWGKRYCDMGGSRNISQFIACANELTNYVSYVIVKQQDVKKRSRIVQYFITVAQHCRVLCNFSSMTAIVSALYSSPIYRLKKTWALVPTESKGILKTLNSLMDSTKNFIKYRQLVKSVKNVACVPFFGVYLSDLTFTFGGNQDYLNGTSYIINFSKRAKIASIIEEIMTFKNIHYKLKKLGDIQAVIESSLVNVPHIEKQYELSLSIEPRQENNNKNTTGGKHAPYESDDGSSSPSGNFLKFRGKKHTSRLLFGYTSNK